MRRCSTHEPLRLPRPADGVASVWPDLQGDTWGKMLCYSTYMERLRADEIARARRTPPAEKFRQALELMAWGIEIQRANFRRRNPDEEDAKIDERLQHWLARR